MKLLYIVKVSKNRLIIIFIRAFCPACEFVIYVLELLYGDVGVADVDEIARSGGVKLARLSALDIVASGVRVASKGL